MSLGKILYEKFQFITSVKGKIRFFIYLNINFVGGNVMLKGYKQCEKSDKQCEKRVQIM